jgi:hypothetical protein
MYLFILSVKSSIKDKRFCAISAITITRQQNKSAKKKYFEDLYLTSIEMADKRLNKFLCGIGIISKLRLRASDSGTSDLRWCRLRRAGHRRTRICRACVRRARICRPRIRRARICRPSRTRLRSARS